MERFVRKGKSVFYVLMILVLSIGLVSCGKKEEEKAQAPGKKAVETAKPAPAEEKVLIFGRGGDSVGLDMAYETDGNSFMIGDNIFEALVAYKDESTPLEP